MMVPFGLFSRRRRRRQARRRAPDRDPKGVTKLNLFLTNVGKTYLKMLSLKNLQTINATMQKQRNKIADKWQPKQSKFKKMVYSTVESDDVDFAVSEADFEEAWPEFRDSWNNLDAILRVNRANTTYKKVTASVRRALEREPCVICFETHHAKQLTTTNCGHTFCRPCLSQHINTCYYDEKEISCPYCRNDKITLTRYYK
jgi:hypothetical protein